MFYLPLYSLGGGGLPGMDPNLGYMCTQVSPSPPFPSTLYSACSPSFGNSGHLLCIACIPFPFSTVDTGGSSVQVSRHLLQHPALGLPAMATHAISTLAGQPFHPFMEEDKSNFAGLDSCSIIRSSTHRTTRTSTGR